MTPWRITAEHPAQVKPMVWQQYLMIVFIMIALFLENKNTTTFRFRKRTWFALITSYPQSGTTSLEKRHLSCRRQQRWQQVSFFRQFQFNDFLDTSCKGLHGAWPECLIRHHIITRYTTRPRSHLLPQAVVLDDIKDSQRHPISATTRTGAYHAKLPNNLVRCSACTCAVVRAAWLLVPVSLTFANRQVTWAFVEWQWTVTGPGSLMCRF